MRKVMVFASILLLASVIIFSASYFGKNSNTSLTGDTILNTSDSVNTGNSGTATDSEISESELSKHSLEEDCWVGFQGKVYDVTSWLQKHPGGVNSILPTCGTSKEFEEAFTKKHGTTKVALFMKVAELIGSLKYQGQLQ